MSGAEIGLLPEVERLLREAFPDIKIRLSSDYSPVLAKALMRRKLDAAFIRPEEQMEDLRYKTVRTDPMVIVLPSKHRLASHAEVALGEIANEAFCLPSKSAPWCAVPFWSISAGPASTLNRNMRCITSCTPYQ